MMAKPSNFLKAFRKFLFETVAYVPMRTAAMYDQRDRELDMFDRVEQDIKK